MPWVDHYRRLKSPVRPFVRRHWRHPVLAGAAGAARRFLAIYENDDHDLDRNGEARVIERLGGVAPVTVLDVGAHHGRWTDLVRRHLPASTVHCFEPSPDVAAALSLRYAQEPSVVVNDVALGRVDGHAELHVHRVHPSLTSMVPSDPSETDSLEVQVRRGDTYLAKAGIEHVELLKIDAEGYDLEVLRGFSSAIERGDIALIQFEYNTWNIRSRSLLLDFYELLEPSGYRIGKVHPDGVHVRPYSFDAENWIGPACVAVHESRPDLARLVGPDRE